MPNIIVSPLASVACTSVPLGAGNEPRTYTRYRLVGVGNWMVSHTRPVAAQGRTVAAVYAAFPSVARSRADEPATEKAGLAATAQDEEQCPSRQASRTALSKRDCREYQFPHEPDCQKVLESPSVALYPCASLLETQARSCEISVTPSDAAQAICMASCATRATATARQRNTRRVSMGLRELQHGTAPQPRAAT